MADVIDFPTHELPNIFGPDRGGSSLIVGGRLIPNVHIYDRGDDIEFILDERLSFSFNKAIAYQAASMMANAMAIGAGYASIASETRDNCFAPQVSFLDLGSTK